MQLSTFNSFVSNLIVSFNGFLLFRVLDLWLFILSINLTIGVKAFHPFNNVFAFQLSPHKMSFTSIVTDTPPKSFTNR